MRLAINHKLQGTLASFNYNNLLRSLHEIPIEPCKQDKGVSEKELPQNRLFSQNIN